MAHSKNSLFQKKWYHFNRDKLAFLTLECNVKNDSIGCPESESDKNI